MASMAISTAISSLGQFPSYLFSVLLWFLITLVIYGTMYYIAKIHIIIWKFASSVSYFKFILVYTFSSLLSMNVHSVLVKYANENVESLISLRQLPLGIYFTELVFSMLMLSVFRSLVRSIEWNIPYMSKAGEQENGRQNVMIIGCGYTGNFIINDSLRDPASPYNIACIIDDDPFKIGQMFNNIPVVGGCDTISENVKKYKISVIIFAISNLDAAVKSKILKSCVETGCTVKTAPSFTEIMNNAISPSQTRDIDINDLLGREPIKSDLKFITDFVKGKTVLVTGGGGSIGSELCRQIAKHSPKKLIIFDIYENSAYELQTELMRACPELDLTVLIGSVRDSSRVDLLLDKYRPDIIYHAAAHKHVPLMEDSPNEAIKNNILGTYKLVRSADKHGVKRFVMISTDKAVNPTNIMGATKRVCEMIIQCFNTHSSCEYVAVRFGNVLGSNGSVIPLFKKQIRAGGPVTVTHPDIIRYFMTIPEAVSLVLEAGAKAKGGEIFVLDMGQPVKILDLANNLITLMGYVPGEDIKIEFTGLRPGEKLYEELLMDEEGLASTENERIHVGHPLDIDEEKLFKVIAELEKRMYDDTADVRILVKELVPSYTYKSEKETVDA
ncbi:MAG: polysaccharide biosynthesis protein [Clostridia bacterium]|nr:polysaccharide biosynthesis protein [Clostridia bacterium]